MLNAAALSTALLLLSSNASDSAGIQWVHDDWTQALKQAKAQKKLIAIDVWATWCHSCLSMKNYALKEAPMAKVKDQHIWLALDYDLPKNAAFFEKFTVTAFPTFMVIDPSKESVVARWIGTGSAKQMANFFADAGHKNSSTITRGQIALARGKPKEARRIFESALADKKLNRADRTKLISGLINALYKIDKKVCAQTGLRYFDQVDNSVPGLDVIMMTAYAANKLDKAAKKDVQKKIVARLSPVVTDRKIPLADDDRSSVYDTLISALDGLGQKAKADALVQDRLALLEDAARSAKTPAARATFDYHRMQVYLRLKAYRKAEKMLLSSEKAQPKDFNHPWRLALVYHAQKKSQKGLEAIERALKNGYGGRRLRLYSTKLDLLMQDKKLALAKTVYQQAQQELKTLKEKNAGQVRPYWVKELESKGKKLKALQTSAKG